MATTPQVPSIPTIAPTQSAADGIATASDIGQLMAPIVAKANQPIPDPYVQGMQVAEPHLQQVVPAKQYNDQRPITGDVQDKNRARRQNAVAGLANTIGSARQNIQEKKQASLKDRLVDVMKYKTNVENAQTVLSDPSSSAQAKQMAQKVMDANKKQLNDLLSDPKHVKEMSKALDISFVDPEKNKTPEVQAYQQAMKEFKEAGPFKSDNPQEHAVAVAAQGGGSGQGTQQQAKPAVNTPPAPKQSATPYADKALSKDTPTIAENPKYAAALQQREEAQKQLTTMIPHLIDSQSKALIQAAKDGNASAREVFKDASTFRAHSLDALTKLGIADAKDQTTLKTTAMRDSATIASASIRANAAVEVAKINGLSREQVASIHQTAATDLDKHINSTEQALKTYGQREADIKASNQTEEQKAQALKVLNYSKQQDENKLKALQDLRAKDFPDIPAPTEAKPDQPKSEGILGKIFDLIGSHTSLGISPSSTEKPDANSKPAANAKPADNKPGINLLGSDESDESDDNSDEDSDSY